MGYEITVVISGGGTMIKDYGFVAPSLTPENYIWFQRQDNLEAYVSLINNKYNFRIHNEYGKLQIDGDEETLPLAMKAVFKFFNNQKGEL